MNVYVKKSYRAKLIVTITYQIIKNLIQQLKQDHL